ncbi:NAD(P)H dehydrogenase [Myxococcus llanfairpwllgwyngyllgogerychwyrndrobwllllantysiliogogogochensis]|uniref:FMN dependent NADH:quinone oxidoreductase n=1 Tax=Myxococcus llanfairpwllgwyngyllgogerychwyrndrobwllllantysiliogogogochensis TaxID=2590453 RepID=A0A540X4S0_9BACT|nr:NAD(P)H-dependent oxidoreductase [Myxococcus llanfairpwllgwyngyllgogerychwyrndrobwllllantysiliogogogochensis]TQF16242.1 NAD(P)H dehydrogenase [Myxococcus llanfairpwllgwyngyllgogerychwyrndrobwllllantysiliogogogochensis]
MVKILHLDSSARPGGSEQVPHGSHTRRLSSRFVARWRASRPGDTVVYRDVGQAPPTPVTGRWIHAAFTAPAKREPWMTDVLAESDALVDELLDADLIVAGVPMYNFNVPAQFKAYIDNIIRVGRTFGFDRSRPGEPYWPLLTEARKKLVILSSRGDFGYGRGERLEAMNHVEPSIRTAFGYIGITDMDSVAVEYDEYGGERLERSIAHAEEQVDVLVARLLRLAQ